MAKRMAQGDSAHQIGLVRYSQGLSDCSGGMSKGGITLLQDFENAKIGDRFACGAPTMSSMAKWITRGDSPIKVQYAIPNAWLTVVRAFQRWELPLLRDSEMRKSGTFLPAAA